MQHIQVTQTFNASCHQVFSVFSDHESLGRIVGAQIARIQAASGNNPNGMGSVRRINLFAGLSFEETITEFEQNALIGYRVTRGSPVKNHHGTMRFSELKNGTTALDYQIHFEPKVSLPGWGPLLAIAIKHPIEKGLRDYAHQLQER